MTGARCIPGRATDRAAADAVPVVTAIEPAQVEVALKEWRKDAVIDLMMYSPSHLAIELITKQVDNLCQRQGRFGCHEVDHTGMSRQHPGGLLADVPEIVLDGVPQLATAQEKSGDQRVELLALEEIWSLVRLSIPVNGESLKL